MATSKYVVQFQEKSHEQADLHEKIYEAIKKEMGEEADQIRVVAASDSVWDLLKKSSDKVKKTK